MLNRFFFAATHIYDWGFVRDTAYNECIQIYNESGPLKWHDCPSNCRTRTNMNIYFSRE